jgi:hypothetical protein
MLCCDWLACARAEMPVWFRIWNLDKLPTSVAISAPRIWSSAAERFCTWLVITALADCSRLMFAPKVPRKAATLAIALLMSVRAVAAVAAVVRSSVARLTGLVPPMLLEDRTPVVVPMELLEPASLRNTEVVLAENTEVPLNVVLLPMRSI